MAIIGYARVSTTGQSLEAQTERLEGAGVEKLYSEKRSGVDAARPELKACLDYVRDGDTLIVTKIDRVARSAADFHSILKQLSDKGVSFKALDDPDADTSTRSGKLLIGILALIAEFENDIRKERQMEGIAKAKAKGTKFGRKKQLTEETIHSIASMREGGMTIPQIMQDTGLSKASVYRALAQN